MLFEEVLDVLHVEAVVDVWVPFECRHVKKFVSEGCSVQELLVLLIIVCESGQLSSLPRVVSYVD